VQKLKWEFQVLSNHLLENLNVTNKN
jgi:hypothetical protein